MEDGIISPPTQPTLKGLLPIRPRSESPERVQEIVRSVLEWMPEHANEMVFWPCAEENRETVDRSDAAMALKSSGGEEREVETKVGIDVDCQEENASEDWPENLSGKNGATLAAIAACRLAYALNVEVSLVVSQNLVVVLFF